MFIYPHTHSQILACIWMVVYLLNVAVRSKLARGKRLHLLSVTVWSELARGKGLRFLTVAVLNELAKRTKGCISLIQSQGGRKLQIFGTESSDKGLNFNLYIQNK